MADHKSSQHTGIGTQRPGCVNEVLCHHLRPRGPLARKIQNQLSPHDRFPLNFPPRHAPKPQPSPPPPPTSSLRPPLERRHFLPIKTTFMESGDGASGVSGGRRGLILSQHHAAVDYKQVPKQEPKIGKTWQPWAAGHSCMELIWNRSQRQMTVSTQDTGLLQESVCRGHNEGKGDHLKQKMGCCEE